MRKKAAKMEKSSTKKIALALCLLSSAGILGACQTKNDNTQANASEKKDSILAGKIQVTEESKISRLMDNKPEASYWFPKDLLEWNPKDDPDAKYNISTIPLQKRLAKEKMPKMNDSQNEKMKVVALSILNGSTSGNVPRGHNTFNANTFSYWQYIDKLVYWGGSSGEGIILPPAADTIDAAHKNGVPILGTVFFPQTAHGGKIEWLDEFLTKNDKGEFPMIDKLLEVADTYGFDGWFINQETDTEVTSFDEVAEEGQKEEVNEEEQAKEKELNQKRAKLMQEFIKAFKEKAKDTQEIMWYDSMTTKGRMDWQNALTEENKDYLVDGNLNPVADDMFLNFWWNTKKFADEDLLKKSQENAKKWNIDPYDLYAGIDLQANGYGTPVRWNLFADEKNIPYTSLGLYVPDWTHFSTSNPEDNQIKENTLWVNSKGDPRQSVVPSDTSWPGISTYQVEQTAITSLPFVTNFNLGKGYNYFIKGEKVSSMDWYNRSMQDIMPTYRFVFDHGKGNALQSFIDFADAYQGGNALKFRGTMTKDVPSQIKLYATEFKIEKGATATTVAKATEKTKLALVLELADGKKEVIKGSQDLGNDWTEVSFDLSKVEGKTVTSIGYDITSTKTLENTYDLHFGQLAIRSKTEDKKTSVKGLKIEDAIFDEEESNFAGIRMIWDQDDSKDVDYYEIYRVNKDDSYSFLGATPSNTHYINALERNDDTNKTNFVVIPVNHLGNRGEASEKVTLEWPDNSVPKASFIASQTLIAPGTDVTFENTSSANTEKVKWTFEGGNITESTDDKPVVKFEKEGTYTVKMTAINEKGETPLEMEGFITVSKDVPSELTLLSKDATAEASSFVNGAEAPEFINDGKLDTKWCATGTPPHWVTLDLGKVQTVSEVKMSHAEAGGESPDMNTKAYTIEVSEDGKEWQRVTRIITNAASETKDTFKPTKARYVRVTVDKPTQGSDSAVRIYEMGVYGMDK